MKLYRPLKIYRYIQYLLDTYSTCLILVNQFHSHPRLRCHNKPNFDQEKLQNNACKAILLVKPESLPNSIRFSSPCLLFFSHLMGKIMKGMKEWCLPSSPSPPPPPRFSFVVPPFRTWEGPRVPGRENSPCSANNCLASIDVTTLGHKCLRVKKTSSHFYRRMDGCKGQPLQLWKERSSDLSYHPWDVLLGTAT